ncbi:MAG: helix-turn-helix transcriptional regulator [Piscinibacter sp.]|nr:helix-turn-helix transcriptional regulator [Piscinibacter sp.]
MTHTDTYFLLLGASIALSFAIVIALWRDRSVHPTLRWSATLMVLAGALYNAVAGPAAALFTPVQLVAARVVAASAVVLLWSIVRMLFDRHYTERQMRLWPLWLIGAGIVAPALAGALVPKLRPAAIGVSVVLVAALLLHMLGLLLLGRRDDLDAYRRLLRLLLAGGGSLYIGLVLLAYFMDWREGRPVLAAIAQAGVQATFKLAWLALTVGSPSPLARLYATTHAAEPSPAQVLAPRAAVPSVGEDATAARNPVGEALAARQAARIIEAVEAGGLYRRQGLSIGELARHLQLPEHRVRSVINGHLGFRNYTAFLNHFRLREVARRLRSAEDAHLPILTIALDTGYASIGPFNRAFRDAFGQTPTEFRRAGTSPETAENPV